MKENKITELVGLFVEKPYHLKMGANLLADRFKCNSDEVRLAKSLAKAEIARTEAALMPKVYGRGIYIPEPYMNGNPDNILVIGDLHLPFDCEGYLEFCREVQEYFDCGRVVQIGDLVDYHNSSYHETIPEGFGAGDELSYAKIRLKEWEVAFPSVTVTLGTHDYIPLRKMRTGMVAKEWMKSFKEVYNTPSWEYVDELFINDIRFVHGVGDSVANMINSGCSVVQGHLHTKSGINWQSFGGNKDLFAMQVGCGINRKAYAFEYAKNTPAYQQISCGVILKNNPIVINMNSWIN